MGKILICHPDEKSRETLKSVLCDHYELILTNDFTQGLDILEHAKDIYLFLLNIDSSKEFSPKNVKAVLADYPKLKIIALSEQISKIKVEEAVKYGASGAIMKTFKSDDLMNVIKKFCK